MLRPTLMPFAEAVHLNRSPERREARPVQNVFVHPQGICESTDIGSGTRIWAFAHVMDGAKIGSDCNLGENVFVEGGASLGNGVTVKNSVAIWDRVQIGDYVFLGPSCVFTNDRVPRSHPDYRTGPQGWESTRVELGSTIGANATIVCGTTLGRWCFIAAGAVVTKDVLAHALVVGNPAKQIGWICECGKRLPDAFECECGHRYQLNEGCLERV